MDFHLVSDRKGWTWGQWNDTPPLVRDLCWAYMQAEADVRADESKG